MIRKIKVATVTAEIKALVEQKMREDDETTAVQLYAMLREHGYNISLRTLLHCLTSLGWTLRGSKCCQLICNVNQAKRLQWAWLHITESFDPTQVFSDVIWTDECSVQLESHRQFCCRSRESHLRINRGKFTTMYIHVSSIYSTYSGFGW